MSCRTPIDERLGQFAAARQMRGSGPDQGTYLNWTRDAIDLPKRGGGHGDRGNQWHGRLYRQFWQSGAGKPVRPRRAASAGPPDGSGASGHSHDGAKSERRGDTRQRHNRQHEFARRAWNHPKDSLASRGRNQREQLGCHAHAAPTMRHTADQLRRGHVTNRQELSAAPNMPTPHFPVRCAASIERRGHGTHKLRREGPRGRGDRRDCPNGGNTA